MKSYAGIGSRKTPEDILLDMEQFAFLASPHLILRSGGAGGADYAFELGCLNQKGPMEIFLPWKGFSQNPSPLFPPSEKALEMANEIVPHFKYVKYPVKLLFARNMHQVLGADLISPVDFVVCWTDDGAESEEQCSAKTGGTGVAIRLASRLNIPIYNLSNPDRLVDIYEKLLQYKT
jgi:hypothetical protein